LSKGALILGGSPAGLQAALDLADSGIHVHLIEPSPFLGNGDSTRVPGHLLSARMLEVAN
jgi:heterodisulfide reductase subunit A-like polyferredoxin